MDGKLWFAMGVASVVTLAWVMQVLWGVSMFDCIFYHEVQLWEDGDVLIPAGCNCTGYGFLEWSAEGPVWVYTV